jgi:uncharacterized protein
MTEFNDTLTGARPTVEDMTKDKGLKNFLLGIYQKMGLGLVITGLMAWAVANSELLVNLLYMTEPGPNGGLALRGYTLLGWVFAFAPLGLSLASGLFMSRLNVPVMAAFYWLFVAVMGVSLSSIVLLYTSMSIAQVFFISAATFGAVSLFGYTTKVNMSGWGSFMYMAVIGLIIAGLANAFIFKSGMLDLAMSAIGVLIFSGLIAYKTQELKMFYYEVGEGNQRLTAAMTYHGALSLYISFINLFLSLLRLFGSRR